MAWAILGVKHKKINKFFLSYYSLITQIIIINIITALIGFIFFCFFSIFLFNNNNNIEAKIDEVDKQIYEISEFLKKNAIFKIPQYNEENGEIIFSSSPELDPYISQLLLQNDYLEQQNDIKIYNSDLIKYADIKDLYDANDVKEVDINSDPKENNYYIAYRSLYFNIYNKLQNYFDRKKLSSKTDTSTNDINLIIETIKKREKISRIFSHENNLLSFNNYQPIIYDSKIYGVVLVRGFFLQGNDESALISFNLFNLFLIIIFFMFLLSIIFTRGIIRPIKILSMLTKAEKDRSNSHTKILNYPIRNDEIGGLSNDIKIMSKELKSRINDLEEFAADVAHEMKNPLASLKSSHELLSNNKTKDDDKKLLFSNNLKDLDRMNRLISDISNYTRTQAEIESQKFNNFELAKFINDLKLSFKENHKKIEILFENSNDKIIVNANIDKLAQVFINIIENAISFSPNESKILIMLKKEIDKVLIYIVDQGDGIKKELKNKIFERFYTDRRDTNNFHTGLGLSISKKIIKSFGGSLQLCDNMFSGYNGACFKLELPIKD